MQFEESRIYTAVEIADIRQELIDKYDYKMFLFEEHLKKAYSMSLSKFRQHPDTKMEIVLHHAVTKSTTLHPAVPVFGKDRIRNGADKLTAACADTVLGVLFDKVPGHEGCGVYSDKEIISIFLFGRKASVSTQSTMTPITQNGIITGFQYSMPMPLAPSAVSVTLATSI